MAPTVNSTNTTGHTPPPLLHIDSRTRRRLHSHATGGGNSSIRGRRSMSTTTRVGGGSTISYARSLTAALVLVGFLAHMQQMAFLDRHLTRVSITIEAAFQDSPDLLAGASTWLSSSSSSSNSASSSSSISPPSSKRRIIKDDRRACRVIIENKVDFHHEILESIVLRYPLPWNDYNCSQDKPILYDFSLFQNRWPNMIIASAKRPPKHLNETEFWSWKTYFTNYLQNRTFDRVVDERQAHYGRIVSYDDYLNGDVLHDNVDAIIDATCDIHNAFLNYMKNGAFYCVLHRTCDRCQAMHYKKSCFLSPMWPKDQCTFIASDLPKFDENLRDPNEIRVCAIGAGRNHTTMASLFARVPYEKYNVRFYVAGRSLRRDVTLQYKRALDEAHLTLSEDETDYLKFHQEVAKCDIMLPGKEPREHPSHYPSGTKKVSGAIGQMVGYKIPSIMHEELEAIYHDYFTAPVEVYNDTLESKVEALTRMIVQIAKTKRGR